MCPAFLKVGGRCSMPNWSLTAEPFGIRIMNVKVWTENILYSHFLLIGEAVIFTCRVHHQNIDMHKLYLTYSSSCVNLHVILEASLETSKSRPSVLWDLLAFQESEFTGFRLKNSTEENLLTFSISMLFCSGGCSLHTRDCHQLTKLYSSSISGDSTSNHYSLL